MADYKGLFGGAMLMAGITSSSAMAQGFSITSSDINIDAGDFTADVIERFDERTNGPITATVSAGQATAYASAENDLLQIRVSSGGDGTANGYDAATYNYSAAYLTVIISATEAGAIPLEWNLTGAFTGFF